MTDRDALIERVKARIPERDGQRMVVIESVISHIEDQLALISLASPSPAQWPEDVVERVKRALLAANVNAHGLEDPDALARAALATLHPPEDERDGFAEELIKWLEARGHTFPEGLDANTAISLLDDHEAALMAPDERVKRLVEAATRHAKGFTTVYELQRAAIDFVPIEEGRDYDEPYDR